MKKLIMWIILFAVILAAVGGIAAASDGFKILNPKDWKIFNKNAEVTEKSDVLSFADEWSLTAGSGENALIINQDTKELLLDDMSIPDTGGEVKEFKYNDKTFVDKIMIRFSVNNDVWNAQNITGFDIRGNVENRTYDYGGNSLYKNMYSNYYNANKDSLNLKSGDCIATLSIDISFMTPESLKIWEDMFLGKVNITDYTKLSNYIVSINIPIIKK